MIEPAWKSLTTNDSLPDILTTTLLKAAAFPDMKQLVDSQTRSLQQNEGR